MQTIKFSDSLTLEVTSADNQLTVFLDADVPGGALVYKAYDHYASGFAPSFTEGDKQLPFTQNDVKDIIELFNINRAKHVRYLLSTWAFIATLSLYIGGIIINMLDSYLIKNCNIWIVLFF